MPKNNPYDKELTPGRQLASNIFFVLIVLAVLSFILWVIFSQPKNVRNDFDPVQVTLEFTGEESEFFSLCEYLDTTCGLSPSFIENYPTASALLRKEAPVWDEQTPYVESKNGSVVLAYSYTGTADETVVTMDVLAFSGKLEDGTFRLSAPLRYTVQYNTSTGVIEKTDLRTDRYRLNFYQLKLSFASSGETACDIALSSVVSDREAESAGLLEGIVLSPEQSAPVLTRAERESMVSGVISAGGGSVALSFGDLMYDYFDGLTLRADGLEGIILSLN